MPFAPAYENLSANTTAPAEDAVAVVANNGTDISPVPRAVYVGTAGNVVVDTWGGSTDVTFKNVPAGTTLPIRPKRVKTTSTAADMVALY